QRSHFWFSANPGALPQARDEWRAFSAKRGAPARGEAKRVAPHATGIFCAGRRVPLHSFAMKFAVIQFPGSNCDQDCVGAINGLDGLQAEYVWHKETSLDNFDAIVLPGGFAYGDYLRCGAIPRFSPIMKAVISDACAGKLVLGSCNGF